MVWLEYRLLYAGALPDRYRGQSRGIMWFGIVGSEGLIGADCKVVSSENDETRVTSGERGCVGMNVGGYPFRRFLTPWRRFLGDVITPRPDASHPRFTSVQILTSPTNPTVNAIRSQLS